jgi:hypothetical protein
MGSSVAAAAAAGIVARKMKYGATSLWSVSLVVVVVSFVANSSSVSIIC